MTILQQLEKENTALKNCMLCKEGMWLDDLPKTFANNIISIYPFFIQHYSKPDANLIKNIIPKIAFANEHILKHIDLNASNKKAIISRHGYRFAFKKIGKSDYNFLLRRCGSYHYRVLFKDHVVPKDIRMQYLRLAAGGSVSIKTFITSLEEGNFLNETEAVFIAKKFIEYNLPFMRRLAFNAGLKTILNTNASFSSKYQIKIAKLLLENKIRIVQRQKF